MLNQKMMQMGQAQNNEVWLFSQTYHDNKWTANFKGQNGTDKLELSAEGTTPEAAIDALYVKWNRATQQLPEFAKAIDYTPFTEVAQPPMDDDIPY